MKNHLLYSIFFILISCHSDDKTQLLSGSWVRVDDSYSLTDTVDIHDDNYPEYVTIYTILTDSGFVDHLYYNDTLSTIQKTSKVDILNIRFNNKNLGLISFERKDTSSLDSTIVEFFNRFEFEIVDDFIITTDGDTIKFYFNNENSLILQNNEYKRLKTPF